MLRQVADLGQRRSVLIHRGMSILARCFGSLALWILERDVQRGKKIWFNQ